MAELLRPALRPGQVLVRHNLAAHRSARAQELVEAAGCRMLVLPPSSPDVNPIEPIFAKIKTVLRAARSHDALLAATKAALDAVTAADAAGCDADCGFPLLLQPL